MARMIVVALTISVFIASSASAVRAGSMGGFLTGLLARGAVRAAVANSHSSSAPVKSYAPDVLTVAQLASCIKKAGRLDEDHSQLETDRASMLALSAQVDASSTAIEAQRSSLNRRSKASVRAFNDAVEDHNRLLASAKEKNAGFNARIDRHNGDSDAYNSECAKKYYADDLADAQKLAANN